MTLSLFYLQRENLLISNLCQKGITCEQTGRFHQLSLQDGGVDTDAVMLL